MACGLVLFIVIVGVMLAMRRRMREEGAAACSCSPRTSCPHPAFCRQFGGLMPTASYLAARLRLRLHRHFTPSPSLLLFMAAVGKFFISFNDQRR